MAAGGLMDIPEIFQRMAVAVAVGLLVGLQRERSESAIGGIRTFALIAMFGAICTLLAESFGGWIVAVGILASAGMLAVGNMVKIRAGILDPGLTTEVAALLVFAVGAYAMAGDLTFAVVVGGTTAVLLHYRDPLHALAHRISPRDITAIMQFVAIALIILPILPNKTYGPLKVLNPFEIWLMVVLIVGIGLAGYVAYMLFGARAGGILAGVLGGLISSTATTVSSARRAGSSNDLIPLSAAMIVMAWTISFARVIVEIVVVARRQSLMMIGPLVVLMLILLAMALILYTRTNARQGELLAQTNPAELKGAILFALLYAAVLLLVAAARQYSGQSALYAVAVISGLTDMDAITLSTSRLVSTGRVQSDVGWRLILLASLSNLAFKATLAVILTRGRLMGRISIVFFCTLACGILMLLYWPAGWSPASLIPMFK
jgi:uncharacterized membrane protein (DUF4010 family)